MPQFNKAVMTDVGASLLARAMAESVTLDFVAIVVGDGSYSDSEKESASLRQRTSLKGFRVSYEPSAIKRESANVVKVSAVISNVRPGTDVPLVSEGFNINEVGLMAKVGTQDPILFSICVVSGSTGDYMPAFTGDNPAQVVQDYLTSVGSEANVSFNLPLTAYALASDMSETVRFVPQSLSESEKTQARANLGVSAIVYTTVEPTEGAPASEPEGTLIAVYEG